MLEIVAGTERRRSASLVLGTGLRAGEDTTGLTTLEGVLATKRQSQGNVTSWTPDLRAGAFCYWEPGAAYAPIVYTFNAPTNAEDGALLILVFYNAKTSSVTLSFEPTGGFTLASDNVSLASNTRYQSFFVYNTTFNTWHQLGVVMTATTS